MLEQQIEFIYNGGEVKRYHTWPTLREDRVDAHSFRVAMLVHLLVPGMPRLVLAALTHDLAEQRFGDVPAPAKREIDADLNISKDGAATSFRDAFGELEDELLSKNRLYYALSAVEQRILKLADSTDGALTCIRERAMGNKLITPVYNNFRRYVGDIYDADSIVEARLINHIDDMWEQANG